MRIARLLYALALAASFACAPREPSAPEAGPVHVAPPSGESESIAPEPICSTDGCTSFEPESIGPLDHRKYVQQARSRALLELELEGLERLLSMTSANSPDRPRLMRRIAAGYVEFAAAHQREQKADAERAAREGAVRHFSALLTEYPGWCRSPPDVSPGRRGCADELLYERALEHESLGNREFACADLRKVVELRPASFYAPSACSLLARLR